MILNGVERGEFTRSWHIISGEKFRQAYWFRGEQLPSLRDLAALWETNPFSIRLAMDDLVCRGLLNRQQGRGVFVASSDRQIHRIGIFCSQEFRLSRDLLAFFYVRDALSRRLRELKFDFCFLDDRASLQEAVLSNQIQAVAAGRTGGSPPETGSREAPALAH